MESAGHLEKKQIYHLGISNKQEGKSGHRWAWAFNLQHSIGRSDMVSQLRSLQSAEKGRQANQANGNSSHGPTVFLCFMDMILCHAHNMPEGAHQHPHFQRRVEKPCYHYKVTKLTKVSPGICLQH